MKAPTFGIPVRATDTIFMVTDPLSENSTLVDVYGSTTLESIGRQVRGGLNIRQENLTLYIGPDAERMARLDAEARLAANGCGAR